MLVSDISEREVKTYNQYKNHIRFLQNGNIVSNYNQKTTLTWNQIQQVYDQTKSMEVDLAANNIGIRSILAFIRTVQQISRKWKYTNLQQFRRACPFSINKIDKV